MQPRVLLGGLAMPESPRWRDSRLWFPNWGTRQIVAVGLHGNSDIVRRQVLCRTPDSLRHRGRRHRVEPSGLGRGGRPGRDLPGRGRLHLGLERDHGERLRPDRRGAELLEQIDLGLPCFATMLGGRERRSLFMLTAAWRGTEGVEDVITAKTGQVLVVEAPAPGVGWP